MLFEYVQNVCLRVKRESFAVCAVVSVCLRPREAVGFRI